jgi:hypothetical protein
VLVFAAKRVVFHVYEPAEPSQFVVGPVAEGSKL